LEHSGTRKSATVLVTGASGFIGRHLVARFLDEPGVTPIAVVHRTTPGFPPSVRQIAVDLSSRGWSERLPAADIIVHLAQSNRYRDFPESALDVTSVNIDATLELADWARSAGVRRFIFASTGNVYGNSELPRSESDVAEPHTMYAASKRCAELLLGCYTGFYEVVILRLFGVYGPGQKGGLVSQIIDRVHAGEEITLAKGVGVRLNPIYVDDCVSIINRFCALGLRDPCEVVNVGGNQIVTLLDIANSVGRVVGRHPLTVPTDASPICLIGDTQKLEKLIPGGRAVALEDGLKNTISKLSVQT
jgi:nucleoside-diphosphate-sugar epimerase